MSRRETNDRSAATAQACNDIQNIFDVADGELEAAAAILDAAEVLCAPERAPVHQDTHPSHDIKTGGGFAHGRRIWDDTLPKILAHACYLVQSASNEMDAMRERAINALQGGDHGAQK